MSTKPNLIVTFKMAGKVHQMEYKAACNHVAEWLKAERNAYQRFHHRTGFTRTITGRYNIK